MGAPADHDYKISKTGVIIAEPPYHAQVWEYPPQDLDSRLYWISAKVLVHVTHSCEILLRCKSRILSSRYTH